MAHAKKRRSALASQKRGQTFGKRGQSRAPKRRQGGSGKPFEKGQPDLPGKRFGEGQPANLGGRPRALKEVKEHIQAWGIEMADTLHELFTSPRTQAKDRIAAIKDLRDWGYGRPKQAVEISGPGGAPLETRSLSDMTSAERRAELAKLMAEAGLSPPPDEDGGDDDGSTEAP